MDFWILYLISIATQVKIGFGIILAASIITAIITGINYLTDWEFIREEEPEERKNHRWFPEYKANKRFFNIAIISLFTSLLIMISVPSSKQLMIITGIYYTTNNEQLKELGSSSLRLLQEEIDKQLDENDD